MKILFLNYEYPPLGGGAANATAYLLDEFSRRSDIEVDLVTSSIDNEYHLDIIGERIKIHKLPIGKSVKNLHFQSLKDLVIYTCKSYFFSRKLLKVEKYDVVQSFFTVPCGAVAWKLHREFSVPYIVSLRGSDVPGYSDRFGFLYAFLRPIARLIWRNAFAVISNSQGLKNLALKTNAHQKIGVVYNGVDIHHFFPRKESVHVQTDVLRLTLGASRLTDRKGIIYLIEAVKLLKDEYKFELKIIGDGNAKTDLERKVQEYDLQSIITFVGRIPREETLKYYQEADIFVLPSLNEGMSNAMLEALACGLPLVTTRTGGAEELVKEGENGLLVEYRSAEDIARALRILASDTALRIQMGKQSRALAESMSWENVAKQYMEVYRTIKND